MTGTIVMTMAGESRRFRDAGYAVPKYRLRAAGRTLLAWSLDSVKAFIDAGWKLVFVGRKDDDELAAFLRDELVPFNCRSWQLVAINEPTDGQASTAMRSKPAVNVDGPFAIFNIDTHLPPGLLTPDLMRGDGWVPCFPGDGDGWSFLRSDNDGRVSEVREKVRISSHCTVGFYGFCTFDQFEEAYREARAGVGAAEMSERYVAPLYNVLIERGDDVRSFCLPADAVVPLGTPAELEVGQRYLGQGRQIRATG